MKEHQSPSQLTTARRSFLKTTVAATAGAGVPYFFSHSKSLADETVSKNDRPTIGVIGAGKTIWGVTKAKGKLAEGATAEEKTAWLETSMFPELFASSQGGIPVWLTGLVICIVVLCYIFAGGSRAAAWANTFQTLVFMAMGVLANGIEIWSRDSRLLSFHRS